MNKIKIGAMLMASVMIGSVFAVGPALASHSVTVSQSVQGDTTVSPGDTVTVDVTIDSDPGASAITGIDVPSGWSFDWVETDGAILGPEGEELTWNEPVSEQNVHTVTYEVTVSSSASDGDYSLTANGAAQGPDSVDDDESDSDTTTVTVAEPSQNEPPTASFTANPSSPEVGEDVSFDASASTDADGSIASYAWDFDDGETATGESVSHAFDAAGDYDVELTVTDDEGATDTTTQTVSVNEAPQPDPASFQLSGLTVESPVEQGDDASVTATVQNTGDEEGTQTVALDVDGSEVDTESVTLAGGASQQVSFDVDTTGLSEGDHDVTVSTDDDSATSTLEVTVEPPANEAPSAAFSSSPSDPETDETVAFDASDSTDSDGSIASYEWDFDGDGTTDATGEQTSNAFDAAGDYDVELTVTDDDGATDSVTETVSVSEPSEPGLSTAVSLSPDEELVGVNGSTTFDVVVEDVDGGVGAYDLDVSLSDDATATITDVSVDEDALTDVQVAEDGSSASVTAALLDTDDTGSTTIATVTVDGDADGTTDVDLGVSSLGTEAGQAYDVTETNGATLTVSELVVGDSDEPAQDLDGDGDYEDVNGDGVVDELDVQVLFAERNSAVVQGSSDAFDFNGDGEFDILDVQALYYEEVA